jgi:hypothetical protein
MILQAGAYDLLAGLEGARNAVGARFQRLLIATVMGAGPGRSRNT